MSESILSSSELEALRVAVESDSVADVGERRRTGKGILLDGEDLPRFRFGEGPIGGARREERLSYVFGKAAQALERRLSDVLERGATAAVTFLQVTRFSQFRETFEVDIRELAMLGFQIAGQPGQGLVVLEPEIVERLVEGLMGGANLEVEGGAGAGRRQFRSVTQLDLRVSQRIVKGFLEDLGHAWNPREPLQTSITAADATGVVGRTYSDSTPVIAGLIEISLGNRLLGMVGLVLPRGALDALADPSSQETVRSLPEPEFVAGPLLGELPGFELDLQVLLGSRRMTVRDVLALGVGDIVYLESRGPAVGAIQGVPKFLGVPGKKNGNKAVRVAEVIDNAEQ